MHSFSSRKTRVLKAVVVFATATLFSGVVYVSPALANQPAPSAQPSLASQLAPLAPSVENNPSQPVGVHTTYQPTLIPVFLYENGAEKEFADTDFAVRVTLASGSTRNGLTGLPSHLVTNKDGVFKLPELTITKPGTYKLIYSQIPQAGKHIAYDEQPLVQTIVVEEAAGDPTKLVVRSSYTKNGQSIDNPRFENRYSTDIPNYRWELPMSAVVALLDNGQRKSYPAGSFEVEVKASADNPQVANGSVPSAVVSEKPVAVDGSGKADLGTWVFNQPGTYEFTLRQIRGNDSDVEYDQRTIRLFVHVFRPLGPAKDAQPDAEGYYHVRPLLKAYHNGRAVPQLEFVNRLLVHTPVETFVTKVETVEVPYTVVEETDPNAYVGTEVVVAPGVKGVVEVTKRLRLLDGKPVGEPEVLLETVVRKMEPRVIRRGTKALPVTTERVSVTAETIPVETVFQEDKTLDSGQVVLVSEGVAGEVEVRTIQTYVDGIPTGEPRVVRTLVRAMVPTVMRRGVEVSKASEKKTEKRAEHAFPSTQLEVEAQNTDSELVPKLAAVEETVELGVYVLSRPSIPKAAEAGSTVGIEPKKRKLIAVPETTHYRVSNRPKKNVPELVVAKPKPRLANTGLDSSLSLLAACGFAIGGTGLVLLVRKTREK